MKKGRPAKSDLSPRFDTARSRWVVDIPAHINGNRSRRFFERQSEAFEEVARIAKAVEMGQTTTTRVASAPTGANLRTLVAAYLAERKGKTSPANLTSLKWGLDLLVDRFGDFRPDEITPTLVDSWVSLLPFSTRGRFNAFAAARSFYNARMIASELCPSNPFRFPPPKKDKGERREILSPREVGTILSLDLKPFFKSWFVCGSFAGLRTIEFERLSYEAFDFDDGEIVVRSDQSKQGEATRPRSITIQPAFKRHIPSGSGPLSSGSNWKSFQQEAKKAAKAIGREKIPPNALRHGFASYHLAAFKDSIKTAYELGHASPTLIYSTYANSVSKKDALAFFAL